MPFQLEAGETVSLGMKRLLLEQVNQIVLDLTEYPNGLDNGVHDARKNCKRIRAAYRLIRDEIGVNIYRQENFRFRDTARLLAGARDSFVLIQTLDNLVSAHMSQLSSQAFNGIRQKLIEEYQTNLANELVIKKIIQTILESMQEASVQISQLPIVHEGFSAFKGGILRVYRRGRKAMLRTYARPSSAGFHEWRKRVKYLWHQFEILEALWPKVLTQLAEELHVLSDYLGDDHDLAVLRASIINISAGFGDENELLQLVQLIDEERLQLEVLAHPLGERLFFDQPEIFLQRMEAYWKAWKSENETQREKLIQNLKNHSLANFRAEKNLVTTTELAARLDITPQKVRKLIYDKKLPAEKVGTIWIIRINKASTNYIGQERVQSSLGRLMSTQDVASLWFTSPDNIRKLIHMGDLPAIKLGQQWVVFEEDLIGFELTDLL